MVATLLKGGGAWSPSALFAAGEIGAWYDPSDLSTMFVDTAGTMPVTADGDLVARINDKSGNGKNATQATSAKRPLYKTSGGLSWLQYDGVDDALTTAAVNLSGVNKLCVFAGVRADLNTSRGTIFNTNGGNFNGFSLHAPSAVVNQIQVVAYGDNPGGYFNALESGLPNSLLAVLTANTNLNSTTNVLRRNGAQVSIGGTAGAGNYTNNPFNIGDRISSSFLSGRIYSLIIRAAFSTADEITRAESYVAGKTGVTL